ncbi:hypothetical protein B9Z19DRAFT_1075420 [Tuber borchii]|uniref:Uncharacterized protein n=1 Tax=Tuber borchii TaxID=42251 RepID=A0A2T7A372_TUBBO|nr:hypothetical protein B9Z19DRAFT_1075420 [Tuber borchii]
MVACWQGDWLNLIPIFIFFCFLFLLLLVTFFPLFDHVCLLSYFAFSCLNPTQARGRRNRREEDKGKNIFFFSLFSFLFQFGFSYPGPNRTKFSTTRCSFVLVQVGYSGLVLLRDPVMFGRMS